MRARTLIALLVAVGTAFPAPAAGPLPAPGWRLPATELSGAVLVWGGGTLPPRVRQKFLDLAGGSKARLVLLCAGADDPTSDWKDAGASSLTVVRANDRQKARAPELAAPLRDATGVWLDGNNQHLFADLFRNTPVQSALERVVERGGVVGGPSAGALGQDLIARETPRLNVVPGLGLLSGLVVDAHFLKRDRVNRLLTALGRRPGQAGLGVDEGTAVVVQGRSVTVLGDSYAVLCLPPGSGRSVHVQVLKEGDLADRITLDRSALGRARRPFPPARPGVPEVPHGSLIIGGGGGMSLSVWRRFIDLAGGVDAPIVVIPTALEDPLPRVPVEVEILRKAGARQVRILHTRDRKQADTPEFVAPLREAKGVWFSGGRQWRFVDAYEGTATERAFHEVLRRGGVIGGSSAGASIQSEYMPRGDPLGNRRIMVEGYERGFGFLPGVAVDQHFFARNRLADMVDLVDTYPQLLGVGIDEGTALVVRGRTLEVVGRSRVAVYDRRRPNVQGQEFEELKPGDNFDLVERKKVGR